MADPHRRLEQYPDTEFGREDRTGPDSTVTPRIHQTRPNEGTLMDAWLEGETAWTISHQHAGLTDLALTAQGEAEAVRLGQRLEGLTFATVLTGPLQRALRTCELAGFGSVAHIEPDLQEWNYGAYEGRTSAEIHSERPDWQLFRDGAPAGESPDQVGARASREGTTMSVPKSPTPRAATASDTTCRGHGGQRSSPAGRVRRCCVAGGSSRRSPRSV
jgi:Histidine phosphatase superfamily (branch 1)